MAADEGNDNDNDNNNAAAAATANDDDANSKSFLRLFFAALFITFLRRGMRSQLNYEKRLFENC